MNPSYDIAVWEFDLKKWQAIRKIEDRVKRFEAYLEIEPEKIWGDGHPFIPRKGEEIQIDHNAYEVVKVGYDLEEDHIRLLVVKLR